MTRWFDQPVENLLVILIIVVVIGFIVGWSLLGRGTSIKNKTVIKGNNNRVVNTQIDNSVRQTQVNVRVQAPGPVTELSAPRPTDSPSELFFYGLVLLAAAFLYLRFFELVALVSMALCAFAIGAGLSLLALVAVNMLGDRIAVSLRAVLLICLSVAAAWFLYGAQQMIDPRLVQAAQAAPPDVNGILSLTRSVWRAGLWSTALASTATCTLCVLLSFRAIVVAYRVGVAGRLAVHLDEASYWHIGPMPSWQSMSGFVIALALMAILRFYWLPQALLAT
jgi:hypothetical protein